MVSRLAIPSPGRLPCQRSTRSGRSRVQGHPRWKGSPLRLLENRRVASRRSHSMSRRPSLFTSPRLASRRSRRRSSPPSLSTSPRVACRRSHLMSSAPWFFTSPRVTLPLVSRRSCSRIVSRRIPVATPMLSPSRLRAPGSSRAWRRHVLDPHRRTNFSWPERKGPMREGLAAASRCPTRIATSYPPSSSIVRRQLSRLAFGEARSSWG